MSNHYEGTADDELAQMRSLVRDIHTTGYKDVAKMARFIIFWEGHDYDENSFSELCSSLSSPDVGLEFWEGTFDDIVAEYDMNGGSAAATIFPETGHITNSDWAEELNSLCSIFTDPHIKYPQTHALHVRNNAAELKKADRDGSTYKLLLTNPTFLTGLVKVYNFEHTGYEAIPASWPIFDDNFLQEVLEAVGYEYADNYLTDWQHRSVSSYRQSIVTNLSSIAELEKMRPGATRFLSSTYGIRHFSRYPVDVLVNQFDTKGKSKGHYGIVLGAAYDHNGVFSRTSPELKPLPVNMYSQVKATHSLMIAEAETTIEFQQRLHHFSALNGSRNKIDFALIESHGSQESIRLGHSLPAGRLALGTEIEGLDDVFSPGACIAMTGCSTGQPNGIAQFLSSKFNTIVVAPTMGSASEEVSFSIDGPNIGLIPKYLADGFVSADITAMYKKGSLFGATKNT